MGAIKYFHSQDIVHRDLKSDNIMVSNYDAHHKCEMSIKIIDFGMSKHTEKGAKLTSECGSIAYMAPEIIKGVDYDISCDLWSIGVIAYELLTGEPPFLADNIVKMRNCIITGDFSFKQDKWSRFTPEAKDWVKKLMQTNPKNRLDADKALDHPWLKTVVEAMQCHADEVG